jgi:hypothetical protein
MDALKPKPKALSSNIGLFRRLVLFSICLLCSVLGSACQVKTPKSWPAVSSLLIDSPGRYESPSRKRRLTIVDREGYMFFQVTQIGSGVIEIHSGGASMYHQWLMMWTDNDDLWLWDGDAAELVLWELNADGVYQKFEIRKRDQKLLKKLPYPLRDRIGGGLSLLQ